MKTITLSGSIKFYKESVKISTELQKRGFITKLPHSMEKISNGEITYEEVTNHKTSMDDNSREKKKWLIENHINKIISSDGILVLNYDKNTIKNYIGGNTLLEMGVALEHKKDIFLLNKVPEISYKDEITGMLPLVLDQDLDKIDEYYNSLPKVYVSSGSRIKIQATSNGLRKAGLRANVQGLAVNSNISEQPIGFEETYNGALNRLKNLKTEVGNKYDLLVSIEAGIFELEKGHYHDVNLVIMENKDGEANYSLSSSFKLHNQMYKEIIEKDLELGEVFMEKYHAEEKDPFNVATNHSVSREDVISQAVTTAYSRLLTRI